MGVRDIINDAKESFNDIKQRNMQREVEKMKLEKERYDKEKAIYQATVEARKERDEARREYGEIKQEYREQKFSFLKSIREQGEGFDGSKIMSFDTGKIQSSGPNVANNMDRAFGGLGKFNNDKPSLFDTSKTREDLFGRPPASYPDKPSLKGPAKFEVYK